MMKSTLFRMIATGRDMTFPALIASGVLDAHLTSAAPCGAKHEEEDRYAGETRYNPYDEVDAAGVDHAYG
jgi:hypothetical protein